MVVAPTPTAVPLSPLPPAAASPTFCDIILVDSSGEQATAHHIVTADDDACAKSTRCSTHVFTSTPVTTSAVAPTTGVAAHAAAWACSSAPIARGAEKGIRANLPRMCSTKCFSHEIDVFKPVDSLTIVWYAPPPLVQFTANIPLGNINRGCFKLMPSSYTPNINPAYSIGADMLCLATNAHTVWRPWDPGLYQLLGTWALLEINGIFSAQLQIGDSIFYPPVPLGLMYANDLIQQPPYSFLHMDWVHEWWSAWFLKKPPWLHLAWVEIRDGQGQQTSDNGLSASRVELSQLESLLTNVLGYI
ncbi:hypothetical protein BS78_01G138100 [Paspalum vaginatum]|nr:hypothetical protein BS78_01G138100 [Paspalum vaginatum]